MERIQVTLPESLKIDKEEAALYLVEKLYELGKISAEQGAELLGINKEAFLELLSNYGLSIEYPVHYPGNE